MVLTKKRQYAGNLQPERSSAGSKGIQSGYSTRHPILLWLVVVAVCVALMILYISQYVALTNLNFRLERAKQELASLENEHRQLSLDVSRLRSVDRIETIARNQLGMVEPEEVISVTFSESISPAEPVETEDTDDSRLFASGQELRELLYAVRDWMETSLRMEASIRD